MSDTRTTAERAGGEHGSDRAPLERADELLSAIRDIHEAMRDEVLAACERQSAEALARIVGHEGGDLLAGPPPHLVKPACRRQPLSAAGCTVRLEH
jgi:hypothetical protein